MVGRVIMLVLIFVVSVIVCQASETVSQLSHNDHELLEKIGRTLDCLLLLSAIILVLILLFTLAMIGTCIAAVCCCQQPKYKAKSVDRDSELETPSSIEVEPTPLVTLATKPTSTPLAKVQLVNEPKPDDLEPMVSGQQPVLRYHVGKDVRQLELTIPPGANDQAEPQVISESEAFLSNDSNSIQSEVEQPPAKRPKLDEANIENDSRNGQIEENK